MATSEAEAVLLYATTTGGGAFTRRYDRHAVLESGMLRPRVHVNAIGAFRPTMRELPDELLGESTVVIDELAAILEESGEILPALDSGAPSQDDLIVLGVALDTLPPLRERTVFKTIGIAAQDWTVARLLADKFLPGASLRRRSRPGGPKWSLRR